MLACIYLSYIFSIACGVNICIYNMVSASQGYACECPCEVSAQIGSKRTSAGGIGRRRGLKSPEVTGSRALPGTSREVTSPWAAMDALLKEGQRLGLEPGTISHVLLGGLEEGDEGWFISHERGASRASQMTSRSGSRRSLAV